MNIKDYRERSGIERDLKEQGWLQRIEGRNLKKLCIMKLKETQITLLDEFK